MAYLKEIQIRLVSCERIRAIHAVQGAGDKKVDEIQDAHFRWKQVEEIQKRKKTRKDL